MSKKRKKKNKNICIFLVIIAVLLISVYLISQIFTIKNIYISGNTQYTDEEIENILIEGKQDNLSFVLAFKYANKKVSGIPFIESIDVEMIENDKVKVNVYEKKIAGYISHLGENVYFDKDGIIVEISRKLISGVPQLLGVDFESVVLYEQLSVKNEDLFGQILEINNLLNKYELDIKKIYFDNNLNMTLFMDNNRIKIGNKDFLYEKFMKIRDLKEEIKDLEGVLNLENYNPNSDKITFTREDIK